MSCENQTVSSWVEGSLEDAAEMLAKVAFAGKELRKTANPDWMARGKDFLTGAADKAMDFSQKNPAWLTAALGGAALGGGAGLASSFRGDRETRRPIRSLVTGGLSGAAAGLGGYGAYKGLQGLGIDLGKIIPGAASSASAAAGGPNPKHTMTIAGKEYAISPEAINKNPELAEELKRVAQPSYANEVFNNVRGGIVGGIKESPVLATALGLDATSLAAGAINKVSPNGQIGLNPGHLSEGIKKILTNEAGTLSPNITKALQRLSTENPQQLQQLLAAVRNGASEVTYSAGGKSIKLPAQLLFRAYGQGQGPLATKPLTSIISGVANKATDLAGKAKEPLKRVGQMGAGAVRGAAGALGLENVPRNISQGIRTSLQNDPYLHKILPHFDRAKATAKSLPGNIADKVRKALYGDMAVPKQFGGTGWGVKPNRFSGMAGHMGSAAKATAATPQPGNTAYMRLLQNLSGSSPRRFATPMGTKAKALLRVGGYTGIPAYLAYRGLRNEEGERLQKLKELISQLGTEVK